MSVRLARFRALAALSGVNFFMPLSISIREEHSKQNTTASAMWQFQSLIGSPR